MTGGRIVLAVSGDAMDQAAIEVAQALAAQWNAPIDAVHVHPPGREPSEADRDAWSKGAGTKVRMLVGHDVAAVIIKDLHEEDTLVVGSARLGTVMRLGSVAEALVSRAAGRVVVAVTAR